VQGIYNYILETNYVRRVCSFAAFLYLQFVLHVMSFHVLNPFYTFTMVLFAGRVQSPVFLFCSSLISHYFATLLRYCLNDFEVVRVAPIITGITFAFTFHRRWIFVVRSPYFRIFLASVFIKFVSWNCNNHYNTRFYFIITNYDVPLIVRKGYVSLHLLVPCYGYLTVTKVSTNLVHGHTSGHCIILPLFSWVR